jgi:anti-anti-sigma regulatory factor
MVVVMVMSIVSLKVNGDELVAALQEAGEKLERMQGDMILDFSSVRRIDPASLRAMAEFVDTADEKAVNVILRSVDIDVYRVLKLARLTQRFSLVS